jgi:ABC-type bacteriocin/lantibiotic exporter with double-glycine peptidase domain
MKDNEKLLYRSEPSIEVPLLIGGTIAMDVLMTIFFIYWGFLIYIINVYLVSIPLILFMLYILKGHEVKIYKDKIYCKDFKYQNRKLKTEYIYFKDIETAKFFKGLTREAIDIETKNGKYMITFVDLKKIIPELKKQLGDKWKEQE